MAEAAAWLQTYRSQMQNNIHLNVVLSFLPGSRLIETSDVNSSKSISLLPRDAATGLTHCSSLPQADRGEGEGRERKVTLSKSVEIQGINYAKWRNMGTWLLLWVRSILICGCQSAASLTPHPPFRPAAEKQQSSKSERSWQREGSSRPEAPFRVTLLASMITVLS